MQLTASHQHRRAVPPLTSLPFLRALQEHAKALESSIETIKQELSKLLGAHALPSSAYAYDDAQLHWEIAALGSQALAVAECAGGAKQSKATAEQKKARFQHMKEELDRCASAGFPFSHIVGGIASDCVCTVAFLEPAPTDARTERDFQSGNACWHLTQT